MNKAICITLPISIIDYMKQQHINKSELIEELLMEHFRKLLTCPRSIQVSSSGFLGWNPTEEDLLKFEMLRNGTL